MTEHLEALISMLESCSLHVGDPEQAMAAAELRRLHEVNQELLEALKNLSLYVAHNGDDWVQRTARAAIAKAQGEQA